MKESKIWESSSDDWFQKALAPLDIYNYTMLLASQKDADEQHNEQLSLVNSILYTHFLLDSNFNTKSMFSKPRKQRQWNQSLYKAHQQTFCWCAWKSQRNIKSTSSHLQETTWTKQNQILLSSASFTVNRAVSTIRRTFKKQHVWYSGYSLCCRNKMLLLTRLRSSNPNIRTDWYLYESQRISLESAWNFLYPDFSPVMETDIELGVKSSLSFRSDEEL